jgi:hypothetical protein
MPEHPLCPWSGGYAGSVSTVPVHAEQKRGQRACAPGHAGNFCRLFICVECCCPLHALLLLTMGAADDASTPDTHPYATAEYWDKVGLPGPWSRGFVDSIFNPLTVLCRGGVSGRPTLWKHATIANPPPRLPLGGLLEMCGYRMQRYRERREESDGERCSIFEWYIRWSVLKEPLSKLIKLQDRLLHLGCGSSALGEDMYRDGYSNAHNVDCSSTIIDSMRQRCAHMPVKTHPPLRRVRLRLR